MIYTDFEKAINTALTLILLTWRIWRASNNASGWHLGFNSVFKGLKNTNERFSSHLLSLGLGNTHFMQFVTKNSSPNVMNIITV